MRHGKNMRISVLDILQTANCTFYKVLRCSNPASGSTFLFNKTTKSWHFQQASLYLCFLFCTSRIYKYPQLNHIFAAHCEIFIGKSKWAGRQLARASFLVVSRYNLDISRFDLDHNLQNICFKYFTHTRYTSNSLPGGEFYPYQRYSLRCFNEFFSSNSHWQL